MAREVLATALAGLALGISAASADAADTGRLIVLDRPGASGGARAAAASAGARPAGPRVPQIGLVTVRPRPGEPPARAARRIAARPGVARVERERRMRLRELPDDPALATPDATAGRPGAPLPAGAPQAWHLLRENFPAAWDVERGEAALVGVIDSGVDATHPDLAGKLAALVDQQAERLGSGPPGVDAVGHGTHVASLACAAAGNAIGTAGAGHDCRLVVEKTDLTEASVAASIVDATDRGAQAINMSFGSDGTRPASAAVRRALRYAARRDVVLVAAASDDPVGEQGDPANQLQPTGSGPDIGAGAGLSVTAAAYDDRRATFAGFGTQISLAAYGAVGAPGTVPPGILGAFPSGPTLFEQGSRPCGCRAVVAGDPRYGYVAGTSMAAPRVAAAAALVRTLNPDLPARAVARLLKRTARRPAGAGWSAGLGWGILDAGAALAAARTIDRTAPVSRVRAAAGARLGAVALDWNAEDPAPAGVVSSGVRAVEVVAVALPGHEGVRLTPPAAARRLVFHGEPGRRYAFFTLARDRAGNVERRPARADAVVRAPGG